MFARCSPVESDVSQIMSELRFGDAGEAQGVPGDRICYDGTLQRVHRIVQDGGHGIVKVRSGEAQHVMVGPVDEEQADDVRPISGVEHEGRVSCPVVVALAHFAWMAAD